MSLILGVEILGEYKNLTAATKGAQSQLATLNKRMSGFSRSMNNALGAIGIGFSLGFIIREFDDMAKAAIDDSKSQTILKDTLKKTVDASDDQVASVEKSISKMQIQTGVLDDKLRPAFGKIIRSTQDLDLATQYMNLALDISAGTGKDVELVAQAIARAVGPDGTRGALEKLVPAIKGANDPMAELERLFGGAAEKAAATDPYNNLKIIFGEMQEQIGISLLPTLYKLSDWLKTPEGQAKLQALVDLVSDVIIKFGELAAWVIDNRDWLVPMVTAIGAVTAAWKLATLAVEGFKTASIIAGAISGTAAGATGAIGAGAAVGGFQQGQVLGQQSQIYGQGFKQLGSKTLGKNSGTTVNINVKTIEDAKATLNSVKRFQNATGTSLGRAITG